MSIEAFLAIFIGLASGIAVGSGFVAFITVLGIVPRLMQISKTKSYIRMYELGIVFGALIGSWISLNQISFHLSKWLLVPLGVLSGSFIGLLAAALTEVLNVFPILARRIGASEHVLALLMAIVFGKIAGSLFQWLYFYSL